jgi:hypothetical protein
MSGMPHLEVYVRLIPMRSSATLFFQYEGDDDDSEKGARKMRLHRTAALSKAYRQGRQPELHTQHTTLPAANLRIAKVRDKQKSGWQGQGGSRC